MRAFPLVVAGGLSLLLAMPMAPARTEDRPARHPDYGEGLRQIEFENWIEGNRLMQKALGRWQEDGELTRIYDNWFEPYLPRFYRGVALFELGCYERALTHLEASILMSPGSKLQSQGSVEEIVMVVAGREIPRAREERELHEELLQRARKMVRDGLVEKSAARDCRRWDSDPGPAGG